MSKDDHNKNKTRLVVVGGGRGAAPGRGVVEEVGEARRRRDGDAAVEAVVEFGPFLAVGLNPGGGRERGPEVAGAVGDLALGDGADGGVVFDEAARGCNGVRPLAVVDRNFRKGQEVFPQARGRVVAGGEDEDFGEELGVLEDRAAEEVVEGAVVDLRVRQVHAARRDVVALLDRRGPRQVRAEPRVALEADARHHDVARHKLFCVRSEDHPAGAQGSNLADLRRELAEVVRDEPDVRHGDGVALVLDLRRPALGHRRAGRRVQFLPLAHLLHVRRGVVVRQVVVEGLDEV
mmetsp:Transcript_29009/g.88648  ORF Transcript_29009/g.88648 Transcript_29009/m.88648 type:complete len:291 (-) Transcript_29009:768-1640(-)